MGFIYCSIDQASGCLPWPGISPTKELQWTHGKMVTIRKAVSNDLKNLVVLKQQVWIATYAVDGIVDDFSSYVLDEFSLEKTAMRLGDSSRTHLLAASDGHLVGYLEIALATICPLPIPCTCAEISTLYVLERFLGKGIGHQLLREGLRTLKGMGFQGAWLSVYHLNDRALAFYRKNGFREIGTTDFVIKGERHKNLILLLEN